MPGPRRFWNNVPDTGDPATNDFLYWVMTSVNNVQGPQQPLIAPMVTTISHPGAVQIVWNEVADSDAYAIFENDVQTAPPGVPIATVPANVVAHSGSYLRAGLNDMITRYYFVQAMSRIAQRRSPVSVATPGTALVTTATVVPISANPINQESVGGGVGGGGAIPGIVANSTSS